MKNNIILGCLFALAMVPVVWLTEYLWKFFPPRIAFDAHALLLDLGLLLAIGLEFLLCCFLWLLASITWKVIGARRAEHVASVNYHDLLAETLMHRVRRVTSETLGRWFLP